MDPRERRLGGSEIQLLAGAQRLKRLVPCGDVVVGRRSELRSVRRDDLVDLPPRLPRDRVADPLIAFLLGLALGAVLPALDHAGREDVHECLDGARIGAFLVPDREPKRHVLVAHARGRLDHPPDRAEEGNLSRDHGRRELQADRGQEVPGLVPALWPRVAEACAVRVLIPGEARVAEVDARLQPGDDRVLGRLQDRAEAPLHRAVVGDPVVFEHPREAFEIGGRAE